MRNLRQFTMHVLVIVCIMSISWCAFSQSSSISYDEITNQIENTRNEIAGTPLKIIYTLETTKFYPESSISNTLSDNKVEIELPNVKTVDSSGHTVNASTTGEYSSVYNLPCTRNAVRVTMVRSDKIIYYKQENLDKEGHDTIWAFDGKKTKFLHQGRTKRKIVNEGAIYDGYKKIYDLMDPSLMGHFTPAGKSDAYDIVDLPDKNISISMKQKDFKKELILTPGEDSIILSHVMEKGNARRSLNINKTAKVGNLILPAEIEKKRIQDSGNPGVFFHLKDIQYEILEPEELNNYSTFDFPEGTIIRENGQILSLPASP